MRTLPVAALFAAFIAAGGSLHAGSVPVTMTDSLESAVPGVIDAQTTAPVWSDPRITGLVLWRGTTTTDRTAHFTNDEVGGVSSLKASIEALAPHENQGFFFGVRAELLTHLAPRRPASFAANADHPTRVEADFFVSAGGTIWTWGILDLEGNRYADRVFIGGPCDLFDGEVEHPQGLFCDSLGLPPGADSPMLVAWAPNASSFSSPYRLLRYLDAPPAGVAPNDPALAPIGAWFRMVIEHDAVRSSVFLDLWDGEGPRLVGNFDRGYFVPFDAVGINGSFGAPNVPIYIDNITASGVIQLCDGDANGDGVVDFSDLNIALGQFSTNGPGLGGDFNGDRIVDFADLNILMGRFNTVCE